MEVIELKNTVTEIKGPLVGLNGREQTTNSKIQVG